MSNMKNYLEALQSPQIPQFVPAPIENVNENKSEYSWDIPPACTVSQSGLNMVADKEVAFYHPFQPIRVNNIVISADTNIGRRKNQEDRFIVAPSLLGGELMVLGIFDGTVREHASSFVQANFLRVLYNCPSFIRFADLPASARADRGSVRKLFTMAILEFYKEMDAAVIEFCKQHEYHYSSSTSVTVFLHFPSQTLYVAHVADSHAALAIPIPEDVAVPTENRDLFIGQYLTRPHRPDQQGELERIKKMGGSLVYLHGNRPFLRGGDFHQRKVAMQLNYSRAFGGKDLKPFGLSSSPDIRVIDVKLPISPAASGQPPSSVSTDAHGNVTSMSKPGEAVYMLVMGSDGIWDVLHPQVATNASADYLQDFVADIAQKPDHYPQNAVVDQNSPYVCTHLNPNNPSIQNVTNTTMTPSAFALSQPLTQVPDNAEFGHWEFYTNSTGAVASPAERLLRDALHRHDVHGSSDNCTSIIVFIPPML